MPLIWQISILNFKKKTIVDGVILERGQTVQNKTNTTNAFKRVLGSYFKKTYANKEIIISIDGLQHHLITNYKGGFSLELDLQTYNSIEIFPKDSSKPIEILQTYPVTFKNGDFPLAIISDIDDTILVSHTSSVWKRINTLLFVSPHKRKPIGFTQEILNAINTKKGRVFYVSKSESNLFVLLTKFIEHQNLPTGSLMLTPYLRLNQLIKPKKGRYYKERKISSIVDNSPEKKFILMGDDTQQDIAVYLKIAELYPDNIFKIYIRKTRKILLEKKKEQLNKLMSTTVPVLYFSDTSDVIKEIELIENYKNLKQ